MDMVELGSLKWPTHKEMFEVVRRSLGAILFFLKTLCAAFNMNYGSTAGRLSREHQSTIQRALAWKCVILGEHFVPFEVYSAPAASSYTTSTGSQSHSSRRATPVREAEVNTRNGK